MQGSWGVRSSGDLLACSSVLKYVRALTYKIVARDQGVLSKSEALVDFGLGLPAIGWTVGDFLSQFVK